ncbi:MAG: GAF domain-containing protein, partial [Chloroflexota bacterium]|nr:GAF domain-containing protein [Chloroflexota bacterium]
MKEPDGHDRQIAMLQERLSRLSDASLRINESLDLDDVLQGVLDSARALTGARYGVITTLDDRERMEDLRVSGLTVEEARRIWEIPDGQRFFEYLSAIPGPLRTADLGSYARAADLGELHTPMPIGPFLGVPIRHRGKTLGNIHLSKEKAGGEFTREDEETLVMFASQVALVVSNARRHRDERRARTGLETLIDTSPVGVAVFEVMEDGAPVSFNKEAMRIVGGLRNPDQTTEQLLDALTVRRADGSEVSLFEFPLAEVLRETETMRAEEIVLMVPDGRSISVLLNATPIRSEAGDVESVVATMQDMTPLEEMERLRA